MTTINLFRAVLEQALEVLLKSHTCPLLPDDCDDAITALRAALAQQAEPVAWMLTDAYNPKVRFLEWTQQPKGYRGDWIKTPLYTSPPQRKPLTEEEIQAAWDSVDMRHPRGNETRIAFARAIERAHGITDPATPACPDCHGIGYDASGQTCACQENPSF